MLDRNASCSQSQASWAVSVHSIWDVEADRTYNVKPQHPNSNEMIAIRCHKGKGVVTLKNNQSLISDSNSLLIIKKQDVVHYYCDATLWNFQWYEFTMKQFMLLPLNRYMLLPISKFETLLSKEAFSNLRLGFAPQHQLASACFGHLLQHWLSIIPELSITANQARVNAVIEYMHEHLGQASCTIEAMAQHVHISTRRLHQLFIQNCNKSPKQFYDQIRLYQAKEWLLQNRFTNEHIADELGYSSAFHFSKAFSKMFGRSPKTFRPMDKQ